MGNESPVLAAVPTLIKTLQPTHIGPSKLMNQDGNLTLLKTLSFSDNFLMEDRHRRLKTRIGKPSPNILNIYQIIKQEHKQLCHNNYQLLVYLQPLQSTLREKIKERLASKTNYSEEELYAFLGRVVDSLIYIQDNGLKSIQLDSQSIVCVGDHVKVLDTSIASSRSYRCLLDHLEKGEKYNGEIYLSPELLKQIQALNYDPYISPKADIFTLGMLLMEMVTLESMQGYYDYTHAAIDYDSLIHRLSRIMHSLPLKTLIAEMLETDPEERIGLVSLKEKIQKLRLPVQKGISRSKSSKMLQNILDNSSRGSSFRNTSRSGSISRQPSSQKKIMQRIQLRCSRKKEGSVQREDTGVSAPVASGPLTNRNQNIKNVSKMPLEETNPSDLKNLVKNKLSRGRDHPRHLKSYRQELPQPRNMMQGRNLFDQTHSSAFESSMESRRQFEKGNNSKGSKENGKGVRATLNKLVEESGMKKLLRLEQLELGSQKCNQESGKNTSRFGSNEQSSCKGLPHHHSKPSDIYIQAYNDGTEDLQTVECPSILNTQPERSLQKVMTFNKQLFLNARTVENSIETTSKPFERQSSQLSLSPIIPEMEMAAEAESEYKNIVIKDVPVVISQEKTVIGVTPPVHFGKLQRQLNLMEYAESIKQGDSIDSSFNTSNVIETYKRHREDSTNQPGPITSEFVGPFKKGRAKRPQLVIQLENEYQSEEAAENVPLSIEVVRPKLDSYKTTQSIDYLSNFTSISPPKDERESEISLSHLQQDSSPQTEQFQRRVRLASQEEYEGELLGDLPHGNGVLYREGKVRFSGSFKFGKFSGYGTLYNLNFCSQPVDHKLIDISQAYWARFEGEFQNGLMSGFGTLFFGEGQKFSGCLKHDIIEGYGCFYRNSGELVSGLWSENQYRKV